MQGSFFSKEETMTENLKTIEEFPDYEVSHLGRVRRVMPAKNGHACRVLKPQCDRGGYLVVGFSRAGKRYNRLVHLLVARVFIPVPPALIGLELEVNHKGDSKTDNRATELEWRSVQGHAQDRMLRHQYGEGVCFTAGKWWAYYSPKPNKQIYLGTFATKIEALAARKAALATVVVRLQRKGTK
jgi:hypothetical protein